MGRARLTLLLASLSTLVTATTVALLFDPGGAKPVQVVAGADRGDDVGRIDERTSPAGWEQPTGSAAPASTGLPGAPSSPGPVPVQPEQPAEQPVGAVATASGEAPATAATDPALPRPPATPLDGPVDPPSAPADPRSATEAGCESVQAAAGAGPPAGWTVRCSGPMAGLAARADPTAREIVLYLRSGWSVTEAARVLAHELGHAYDWALLDDADRQAWMDARGLEGDWGSWCPRGAVCGDTDRPAGDWAEAVGEVLVPGTDMWSSELGPLPTPEQLELARRILTARGVLA